MLFKDVQGIQSIYKGKESLCVEKVSFVALFMFGRMQRMLRQVVMKRVFPYFLSGMCFNLNKRKIPHFRT